MSSNNNVLYGLGILVALGLYMSYKNPTGSRDKLKYKPFMWLTSPGLGYEPGIFPMHRGLGYSNIGEFHPQQYAARIGDPYITTRYARENP